MAIPSPHRFLVPRSAEDLGIDEQRWEPARQVASARIVWADHAALESDFPWLPDNHDDRNRWMLRHAVVSEVQAAQTDANTAITTVGDAIEVLRPIGYGRACVLPVRGPNGQPDPRGGLVDAKGTGVIADHQPTIVKNNKSGLMPLDDAIYELAMGQLLGAVFEHAGVPFAPLPTYAVLDLGFDGYQRDGTRIPAGCVLRRAHRRRPGIDLPNFGTIEHHAQMETELLLRHYGISSAVGNTRRYRRTETGLFAQPRPMTVPLRTIMEALWPRVARGDDHEFERVNVQLAAGIELSPMRAQVVDFEQYHAWPRFEKPLLSLVYDRPLQWGGVLWPDDPDFVQPDPALAVPADAWDDRLTTEISELVTCVRNEDGPAQLESWLVEKLALTRDRWAHGPTA